MTAPTPYQNDTQSGDRWIALVREKARRIRFGSVQLIVHDGRVVQIDATERTRLPPEASSPADPAEGGPPPTMQ